MTDIKEKKTVEYTLGYIRNYIKTHQLQPGDKLPGELELAEMIGVARSSVREALSTLKTLGVVVSKRKGGIRLVREPILLDLRDYLADTYDDPEVFNDASEFRGIIERGMAELIYEKITPATIAKLKSYIDQIKESIESANLFVCEQEFHKILNQDCKNKLSNILSYMYTPIFDFSQKIAPEGQFTVKRIKIWIERHECLVDSLENRQKDKFIEQMNEHTSQYLRF